MTEPKDKTEFSINPELAKWTSHQREHDLLEQEHRREHEGLIREVSSTARALEDRVRETAKALAEQFANATTTLETRVREVAELHWDNHRVEHENDQRAVDKVERNMVDKFESVNEFRNQQKDIIAGFLPRAEYDGAHAALVDRVDQIRGTAVTHITREEYSGAIKALTDRLGALETYRSQNEGRDRGSQPFMAVIISVVTAVLSALAVGAVVIATRTQ